MRTLLCGILTAGLLLAWAAPVPAQDAKAILDKAVKAHGGLEKLNKSKAIQTKSKGQLELMGNTIDFTQEATVVSPDKIKEKVSLTINGQQINVTSVYNGKQGWINANGN